MPRTSLAVRNAAFAAAVLASLGFGARAAWAGSPAGGDFAITCPIKQSTSLQCHVYCQNRGEYYYSWNSTTKVCCCSTIAP